MLKIIVDDEVAIVSKNKSAEDTLTDTMFAANVVTELFAQVTGLTYDVAALTIMQGLVSSKHKRSEMEDNDNE